MNKFWSIFFIGTVYLICENNYFGWNAIAQSSSEVIADGLCLIINSASPIQTIKSCIIFPQQK